MKKYLFSIITCFLIFSNDVQSQNIQSPDEFLGYELGTKFSRHHKVIDYFTYISTNSNQVVLEKYGETNEGRPLFLSFISSEENIRNLEIIRNQNLKKTGLIEEISNLSTTIVWLSYNVHGNEASSSEASMLTLYKLLTEKKDWLKNTVVIIDPCLNPDGRDRYVNWYNQTKSEPFNVNPEVTEHNEPWPGGRPNHYLFDLNRDWMWATQVETQQRIKIYNKWMPHIHVDFHEQFINNPYYFAPGAEPFHEIITDWQREFQTEIGKNNAKYFDQNGWRYFTKESFDLFYPSYGDSYPTFMGAIGMTYEQAGHGKAGLGITTENNTILTLKDRIEHHTTTGLSTVEVASNNAKKIIEEFGKFFNPSENLETNYILNGNLDKIKNLKNLLQKHEILSYQPEEKSIKVFEYNTKKNKILKLTSNDLVITTNQPKGKMVKVLFEPNAKLSDSVTYDITAWNLGFAYGLNSYSSKAKINPNNNVINNPFYKNEINNKVYAYLAKWNEISDAQFLSSLLKVGCNVRFSKKEFSNEGKSYEKGTLIIMKGENMHLTNFDETITELAYKLDKKLTNVSSGFVTSGPDFGSESISLIKPKKVAVLSGEGTSSLSFGEIWHFFETQLKYPLHIINTKDLKKTNFNKYDILILPDGYEADKNIFETLTTYATNGGTIISIGRSLNNFADKEGFNLKSKKDTTETDKNLTEKLVPYSLKERKSVSKAITGSIFKSTIDNTHPLAFGYRNSYYSLKLSSNAFNFIEKGETIGYFVEDATNIAGFAGYEALKKVPNSLLFGIEYKGRGQLIYMVDNPLFRSFWENGKLFFANAIFLN
jgi:hypothetical protein